MIKDTSHNINLKKKKHTKQNESSHRIHPYNLIHKMPFHFLCNALVSFVLFFLWFLSGFGGYAVEYCVHCIHIHRM